MQMTTFIGHFDGKSIVPDETVDLPRDQRLVVRVEPAERPLPRGISGEEMVALARKLNFPKEDLEEMKRIIEEN